MKMFISFIMIFFSFLMYFFNNPLSMGMMILMQTMLTCMMTGMLINTYWFSYILFLTFLGGLLVLFIYVSSIASNELFMFSNMKMFKYMIMMFFLFMLSIYYIYNLKWLNFYYNEEMSNFFNYFNFFNNENKINLSKLYNNQTFLLMTLLIMYLLITLIAIVKITNIFYGPIRSNYF